MKPDTLKPHYPPHQPLTRNVLNHISVCDTCALEFAESMEKNGGLKAPKHLKAEVMSRCKKNDTGLSKKAQLFLYSLRVGAAVAAALYLVIMVPAQTRFRLMPIQNPLSWETDHNQNKYNLPEDTIYDEKEK